MNNQTALNYAGSVATASPLKVVSKRENATPTKENALPEILFITSYPPRECGIATYSQDLIEALNNQFTDSFSLKVCALESGQSYKNYPEEVKYILNTNDSLRYVELAHAINIDKRIKLVMVQHEFGLFQHGEGVDFLKFLYRLTKPIILVFHTVLPKPDASLKLKVWHISAACESIIVMTQNAAQIIIDDYGVPEEKVTVIAHGTHLVPHLNKDVLKEKHGLVGRKVLSTFGLLSSGKSIETTLDALPSIIEQNLETTFLVIGKTHSGVVKSEGETYRHMLEAKVKELNLENHVKFINKYVTLKDLLEYLQMTDIYLFTSKDPHQAVSGTFSYAMSCGCPIISTPIPHAKEVLKGDTGIIIDFQDSKQLAEGVNRLLGDDALRMAVSSSSLQRIVPTVWENSANAHALLLQKIAGKVDLELEMSDLEIIPQSYNLPKANPISYILPNESPNENPKSEIRNPKLTEGVFLKQAARSQKINLNYRIPIINLEHVKKMTTDVGIIQFSIINQPDITTGYTLDDNARALVAMCMHYECTGDEKDIAYISTYLHFLKFCQQPAGDFLNYVDSDRQFTEQNHETNLSDSNGRALWALGFLISKSDLLPASLIATAKNVVQKALPQVETMHSTRAMAFTLKGLYYANLKMKSPDYTALIKIFADRIVQMYRHEAECNWQWFESYLTYGNSILPEAMLCAYLETGDVVYKQIAKESFDFLLSLTFNEGGIKVISNKSWLHKGQRPAPHGEQPIDVAYTILALDKFYQAFKEADYSQKMVTAFNWFLGKNHLNQIIYNSCTGGCYDGLEDMHVNLNQGSESTLSYLMARLTIEKHKNG